MSSEPPDAPAWRPPAPPLEIMGLRTVFWLTWAVWWGGLTFYAAVVVPLGTEQFGGMEQGYLTAKVTIWLHLCACALIVILILRTLMTRQIAYAILTAGFAILTGLLAVQRQRMLPLMGDEIRAVADSFYTEHALYLWLTTAQWFLGIGLPLCEKNSRR